MNVLQEDKKNIFHIQTGPNRCDLTQFSSCDCRTGGLGGLGGVWGVWVVSGWCLGCLGCLGGVWEVSGRGLGGVWEDLEEVLGEYGGVLGVVWWGSGRCLVGV